MASDKSGHAGARKKTESKLKSAKDSSHDDNEVLALKGRKENAEVEDKEEKKKSKSKKRRLQDTGDADADADADVVSAAKKSKKAKKEEGESESRDKKKKKTKAVSFSVDTEVHEIDNGDDNAVTTKLPIEDEQADDEADTDKKNKKKKEKRKKEKKDVATGEDASTKPKIHEAPILSYLNLYHKHRAAWKFQKNRETQLFKQILSLEYVPAQYNAALLAYLQGLKSEGAKQRLREIAEAAAKTDIEETQFEGDASGENTEESIDQSTPAMVNYRKAVGAFRAGLSEGDLDIDVSEYTNKLDEDMIKRFEKRQRAEVILFAVDGALYTFVKPKAPSQKGKKGGSQDQPQKKKKKNRTAFIEISSSSESESSSDSDSDGDSDAGPVKQSKNKSTVSDSSDTSSDSNDSDSDSDSSSSSSSGSSS